MKIMENLDGIQKNINDAKEIINPKKGVIETARAYINKKEKPGNSGFEDAEFEKEMIAIGWEKGMSWCALFAKMIFNKAKPGAYTLLFNPGAVKTFNNFRAHKYQISNKPVLGSLVIWQDYKNGIADWHGHAGIVSGVIDDHTFMSIEGNTSGGGSRNGDRVFEHTRKIEVKKNGLNVLGFVIIP
jgi:hypothetical protein